jgi:hypothetical protein
LDLDSSHFATQLAELGAELVIHCAGPFQGQDYRVAQAALASGSHYIDLADGREFVAGFVRNNHAAAIEAGRLAITGASTLPALSSAVVDSLIKRFSRLDSIEIVIAPGQHAPRGIATMRAVLSYAGRGFSWWQDGSWSTAFGWQELKRVRLPYGVRCAAACDVPDLELFPARYPGVKTVTFRAALEIALQHFALWFVAGLRRAGLPLRADHWATALAQTARRLDRFGTDLGGMSIWLGGVDEAGRPRIVAWQLVAGSNHGPEIPAMAATLLAKELAAGHAQFAPGAHVCMGMVSLGTFEDEFARWNIQTSVEEQLG